MTDNFDHGYPDGWYTAVCEALAGHVHLETDTEHERGDGRGLSVIAWSDVDGAVLVRGMEYIKLPPVLARAVRADLF